MHKNDLLAPLLLLVLLVPACTTRKAEWECSARVDLARVFAELKTRHDLDGDDTITAAEYSRGPIRFANYDRNEDGVLTDADFPEGGYWNGFAPWILRDADGDRNGEVTRNEFATALDRMDANGDRVLDDGELAGFLPEEVASKPELVRLSFDQDLDGVLRRGDLEQLFADCDLNGDGILKGVELAGRQSPWQRARRAPAVGDLAPDFTLGFASAGDETVTLSSLRSHKPVALVFGSYT